MPKKKDYKIYDIDYLENSELTEDDLYYIFECKSLTPSLIVGEYRAIDNLTAKEKILKDIKSNSNWLKEHKFRNKKARLKFMDHLIKISKNVYQFDNVSAKRWVDDWMIHYGFSYTF
jgi:hypothetical protein